MAIDSNNKGYFALLPTEEIGSELIDRLERYYIYAESTDRVALWRKSYRQYYSGYYNKGSVTSGGSQNELSHLQINHFKSIIEHLKVMTTAQRPMFEPRAINSDYKSYSQTLLAKGLLDYYVKQKDLERIIDTILEYSLLYGEGWLLMEWDADQGDIVTQKELTKEDVEKGKINTAVRTGDVNFRAIAPIDLIRDYTKNQHEAHEWYIVRRLVNKYELSEKYPEFREELESYSVSYDDKRKYFIEENVLDEFSDEIPLYTFIHKRTAAVPEGRMIDFTDNETIMFDGELPYKDFPLKQLLPSPQRETPFGYSVAFDMLPIQYSLDALYSTILTNQITFGVQNVTVPKGSNISVEQIVGGLNFIDYNPSQGKPEALNLTKTPAEIFQFADILQNAMETISGINSVTRGNPEASLKSGAALALVQSMSIQFNKALQGAYVLFLENMGTGILNMLKEYASSTRVALITGVSNRSYLKEFTGSDLENIDRVIVDLGNPLTRTVAGRENIANTMLERGLVKTPEQYMQVLNTGTIEPVTEGLTAELMLIKSENESMTRGEEPPVLITDNHLLHINEHKAVLSTTEARETADVTGASLQHIKAHIMQLQTGDPQLLMVLGQQPINQPGAPMPVGPGGEGGGEAPPAMPGSEPGMEAAQPNMPSMPTNPLSGEQFNNETGGL